MISINFKGYKNFSDYDFVGFNEIKRLNIIIGKNNIGKTALLESVKALESVSTLRNFSKIPREIKFKYKIINEDIQIIESRNNLRKTSSGGFYEYYRSTDIHFYSNDLNFLVDQTIEFELEFNQSNSIRKPEWRVDKIKSLKLTSENYGKHFSQNIYYEEFLKLLLTDIIKFRVNVNRDIFELIADRDIKPEVATNNISVLPNGEGATNIIQNFLSKASRDASIIEETMLIALNDIFINDIVFSRISIQDISNDDELEPLWEIFLHELEKPPIALSESGSGLRTIILVLIKLLLEANTDNSNIIIFEELENNLHPAIQRSLYRYIFRWAKKYNQYIFITTHSNIPIDMVVGEEDAQLIHVHNQDGIVHTTQVLSSLDSDNIFNDLEVKASDLLQSNGIIWVEGPSDRIYINKWIELYSNGQLIEDKHYQIMFYGGKLLSHLSGDSDFEILSDHNKNDFIKLLLINRNSAIVIDSDRKKSGEHINQTKQRIRNEFENLNKFVWITNGREIENYLSFNTLKNHYDIKTQIGQYENIGEYLKKHKLSDTYNRNKTTKARILIDFMTKEDLDVLDLKFQIATLCKKIKSWNNL